MIWWVTVNANWSSLKVAMAKSIYNQTHCNYSVAVRASALICLSKVEKGIN